MTIKDWNIAEEETLLKLKSKKLSYLEIAEIMGRTPDSLRLKFWRLVNERNLNFENGRVLVLDIETSLMIFTAFRTGEQYLGDTNILKDWFIMSWSAKWLGEDEVFSDVLTPREAKRADDKRICKSMWTLLDDADIVIAHNGDNFDLKRLNTRFVYNKLKLPRPYKSIDTLKLARKMFYFSSNRLDYLLHFLGLGAKKENDGYPMWLNCLRGDKQALQDLVNYNKDDVTQLEKLYNVLKEGITTPIRPKYGFKD